MINADLYPAVLMTPGRMEYRTTWQWQRARLHARIDDRCPDTLMLGEHEPVFTIGRSGKPGHWGGDETRLLHAGYPVYHVERGGSITYHGPGQLVGYPILRLNRFCAGPKAYMRLLEEVLLRTLRQWAIPGDRLDGLTGVWVDGKKIAAMGVRIVRGVTMHGFALNVTTDLSAFQRIVPCGIAGCRVTSMAAVLGHGIDVVSVRRRLAGTFASVFGLTWTEEDAEDSGPGLVPDAEATQEVSL